MISPNEISSKGEQLYKEKFQQEYELTSSGKFLAIDITTATAFLADTPDAAIDAAAKANPGGYFHIVRIGAPGVYRVGYTQSKAFHDWKL